MKNLRQEITQLRRSLEESRYIIIEPKCLHFHLAFILWFIPIICTKFDCEIASWR